MLTDDEKRQFVRDGFIIKHIPVEPKLLDAAVNLTWKRCDPQMLRDRPETWKGEIRDDCRVAEMSKRRGRVKLRESVRDEKWLVDIIYNDPQVLECIRDLMGPDGVPRKYIRGLCPVFPSLTSSNKLDGGMDAHPFQVGCITYIGDVKPNGGGFTVWPDSHYLMRYAFHGLTDHRLNSRRAELEAEANRKFQPFEIVGQPGTRIFWHYRLLHTAGTNRLSEVRYALLADFVHKDWQARAADSHDDFWRGWAVGEDMLATV